MPEQGQHQPARLLKLKEQLVDQANRVRDVVDASVVALFENDASKAQWVLKQEDIVDRVDIQIEHEAVRLLHEAVNDPTGSLGEYELRLVLTIVKVNNELERISDLAVRVISRLETLSELPTQPPRTFRVLGNSIVGIVQTTAQSFAGMDADLAALVLSSDDATEAFREEIQKDLEKTLAAGKQEADVAFALNRVSASLARMADHCTNIAEQVIYVTTGKIIRHSEEAWIDLAHPNLADDGHDKAAE